MDHPVRILTIGGDASLWIGLSSSFGAGASQIYVPRDTEKSNIISAARGVDIIVLVVARQGEDRFELLEVLEKEGLAKKTIVVADGADQETAAAAVRSGASAFINKGSAVTHLALAVRQVQSRGQIFDAAAATEVRMRLDLLSPSSDRSAMAAARALASALELKDTYTGGHAERVTAMAMRLARVAELEDAPPSEALEAAFLLHDVGKIGIPESILNKPSGLTDTERRVLQTHPILGERVVAPLGFPDVVRQVIRHHHERWDGSGYPDGLIASEIPASARLFAIADVIDAMTSIRPYRKPVTFQAAVKEIMVHAGTQFDPTLCALVEDAFLEEPVELLGPDPLLS